MDSIAIIKNNQSNYDVCIRTDAGWRIINTCAKKITAVQMLREIKAGNFKLNVENCSSVSVKSTEAQVLHFMREIGEPVSSYDLKKKVKNAKGAIARLLAKGMIERAIPKFEKTKTSPKFRYALRGTFHHIDFKKRVIQVLLEHPEGLHILSLYRKMDCAIPYDSLDQLKQLIRLKAIVNKTNGPRLSQDTFYIPK